MTQVPLSSLSLIPGSQEACLLHPQHSSSPGSLAWSHCANCPWSCSRIFRFSPVVSSSWMRTLLYCQLCRLHCGFVMGILSFANRYRRAQPTVCGATLGRWSWVGYGIKLVNLTCLCFPVSGPAWVSALSFHSNGLGPGSRSQINPFLPKLSLAMVFPYSNRKANRKGGQLGGGAVSSLLLLRGFQGSNLGWQARQQLLSSLSPLPSP